MRRRSEKPARGRKSTFEPVAAAEGRTMIAFFESRLRLGRNAEEIAAELGMHQSTVARGLHQLGFVPSWRRPRRPRRDQADLGLTPTYTGNPIPGVPPGRKRKACSPQGK